MGATNERQLHFRCSRRTYDALQRLARTDGVTVAALIRQTLLELLRRRLPREFGPGANSGQKDR
jgi:hypothetical protein